MRRWVRARGLHWTLLAVLLSTAAPAGVPGQNLTESVQARQRELQKLKEEIEANRREMKKLEAKERDLGQLRERIRRDQELTRRYLQRLSEQDQELRSDMAERQVDLLDKESQASQTSGRLKRRVVQYYKLREMSGPELLFSSRSFGELFARAQFLARMIYRDRVELVALADERQVISQAASILDAKRRGVASLQEEKRREEDRLRRQSEAAQVALVGVRDERAERQRHIEELEKSEAAIRKMITRLEQERARSKARGSPPAYTGSLESGRGRLSWPLRGDVVGEFGWEVNPRYGTKVPSNGVDIAAPEGAEFRSVGPGLVEFVDWLPGYGRTVIVNHGSGFYTLYAHASALMVQRGQKVEAGEVLGRVGDSDSIKGFCLHFEIRRGEQALNPREWLK